MPSKTQSITRTDLELKKPHMFAIYLHNDDYTTMDFVVEILVKIFHKNNQEASSIMMAVHENGQSIVDIYTYDIAVTKKMQTDQMAAEKGFPLKITVDEVTNI